MLVGQTGSGKTTLARALLAHRRQVVVLDAKGMIRWKDYRIYREFGKLLKADPRKEPRLIYKPSFQELQDFDLLNRFFVWVYQRRHCTCYVDELMGVTRGEVYPEYMGGCLTRGRELDIELWTATQRPLRIPQVAMSEAEHTYAFKLKMPQDRRRVYDLTGIDETRIAALAKRQFLYSRQDGETQGPLTLDLGAVPTIRGE